MKKAIVTLLLAVMVSITAVRSFATRDIARPEQNESKEQEKFSEADIVELCKWYVNTLPSDDPEQELLRMKVATQIIKFGADTKKFTIDIKDVAVKVSHDEPDLLMVYIAGETMYCLEHNLKKNDANSFASAMEGVVNFYSRLPKQKNKTLNKYLKMTPAERMSAFRTLYDKK